MKNSTAGFFDTHVHLDRLDPAHPAARELRLARRLGVDRFLVPGVRPADWDALLDLVRQLPGCLAAPGCHPLAAGHWSPEEAERLKLLLALPAVAALGEVGLDRSPGMPGESLQEKAFVDQVRLAVAAGKPLLIHCRKSTERMLHILRQEEAFRVGGIMHGFSGSLQTALEAVALGFALGFNGSLTWPGARRPLEVLKALPEEAIVLESDAPDMSPHPYRGRSNRPACLLLVARAMAEARGWSLERTAQITRANALRVLRLGGEAEGIQQQE